jgi:SAM-dependent methyltransferase
MLPVSIGADFLVECQEKLHQPKSSIFVDPMFGPCMPEERWVPPPRYLLRRDRVLRIMADLPPGRLLEVGCGPGALLYEFAQKGFSCSALELSPSAREIFSRIHPPGTGVDLHSKPQDRWQGHFDYVCAFEVLEHIQDDEEALRQWGEWLKPGGRLILSVPAHMHRWSASDEWAGHWRRYEKAGLVRLLKDGGMSLDRLESYGFPLANMVAPLRVFYHRNRLRKEEVAPGEDRKDQNNLRSGSERNLETSLFILQKNWFGKKIIRWSLDLQDRYVDKDLGDGYLLVAIKK